MTSNKKYKIHCPKCRSTFNISEQINIWKEELFEDINKLVKKKLKEKN